MTVKVTHLLGVWAVSLIILLVYAEVSERESAILTVKHYTASTAWYWTCFVVSQAFFRRKCK